MQFNITIDKFLKIVAKLEKNRKLFLSNYQIVI